MNVSKSLYGVFCDPIAVPSCLDNRTFSYGGGVYSTDSNSYPVLTNCTFSGNHSDHGGGIYGNNSSLVLTNCIIWGNNDNGGMDESTQIDADGGTVSLSYCCVQGWTGMLGGIGNFDADPCFVDPGYWDDNDTPSDVTDDLWVDGDYHLKSQTGCWNASTRSWVRGNVTSRCIDSGDPNADWIAELWPHGERINLGAYGGTRQASMSSSNIGSAADCNSDGLVNAVDLLMFAQRWLADDVLLAEDINRDGMVNFPDYAELAKNWLRQEP